MGNPLTDKDFVRLLDDRLEKVYTETHESLPSVIDTFFDRVQSSKAWMEYFTIGSMPDPEEFNGTIQYQDVSPGYHIKIEPSEWTGGLVVQRRLLDTDRYDIIEGRTKQLARAANRKMNKIAHNFLEYHDSTAFTFLTHESGEALCANSHASKSGLLSSGNDNLSTLPFNAANLEAVRIQSVGLRDDINERIVTNFDTIVHGTNLAEEVWEVMKSEGKVDEMTNNANFQRGRWKSIELPLLDDTDTNDWFIVDSAAMKENLKWIDGIPLEFMSTTDFDTMMRKYADYFVVGWGWIDWRFIISSSVS